VNICKIAWASVLRFMQDGSLGEVAGLEKPSIVCVSFALFDGKIGYILKHKPSATIDIINNNSI